MEDTKSLPRKPQVEMSIPGIEVYPHYMVGHEHILKINFHNFGNTYVPSERHLLQAVVVSGSPPESDFFNDKNRAIYQIPEDCFVSLIVLNVGILPQEEADLDLLLLTIFYTNSLGEDFPPLQHVICQF